MHLNDFVFMVNKFLKNIILAFICVSFFPLFCFSQDSVSYKPAVVHSSDTTAIVAANPSLKKSGIKQMLVGKNYRKEWTQPVTVPVLNLQQQGLIPEKEGGGKQTKSLHMKDSAGKKWAMRSVQKFPEKVVPEDLKQTVGEKIVADEISASYPYGALSMPVFSKAAGIPYLRDRLTFLPDDTALGKFRDKYKETLVFMEEKEPYEFLGNPDKKLDGIASEDLIYKLQKKNTNRVDQSAVLRVRLLDNFVMDFDRHEGQWNWLKKDSAGANYYFPVPKDRDQVFFVNQGLLPKIVSNKSLFPELQGFRAKTKHISTFNRAAQNFDRTYLTELSQEDWSKEIDYFLSTMTDAVIDSALALQPKEIQPYSTHKITSTLKKKRQFFKAQMMEYYRTLSKTVSVTGSNENENFLVKINDGGSVQVTVTNVDSASSSTILYNRLFDPAVTKEIRLYGLEGNDKFTIEGAASNIKIRIIGGPGDDGFSNKSLSKQIYVYDVRFEKNAVEGKLHNRINNDPLNNVYNHLNFKYNLSDVGPAVELSGKQGLFIGANAKIFNLGFHKNPYSSKQVFSVTHALNSSSFHFRYDAGFTDVFSHTDLLIRADMWLPTNRTNFFGLGNNTVFNETKFDKDYYRMRYDLGNVAVLGRTKLGNSVSIEYGPAVQYLVMKKKENENKLITALYPLNYTPGLYQKKWYGGGEFHFDVDTKNNAMLTTRGVHLNVYVRALKGLNSYSGSFTQTGGRLALYTDFSTKGSLVFATNFGADHNIGNFEPQQSQFLGFTEHLRGYVSQRFAGRSAAYNQTELRIKFGKINALLVKADLGVYGFNDIGRVWADGEKSNVWHDGYGGGIWLGFMRKLVVSGYLSFSNEIKALPRATLGFAF